MKKLLSIFLIVMIFTNVPLFKPQTQIAYANEPEADIIEFVLGKDCLNILPQNHNKSTLSRGEMVDILIRFTNVSDDYKAALMNDVTDVELYGDVFEYADYHVDPQKEELVRRLKVLGILPGGFLLYPDKLCTREEAFRMIISVWDRTRKAYLYGGYFDYAEFRRVYDGDFTPTEMNIYDDVKELLFYSLFPAFVVEDDSKSEGIIHGQEHYKAMSDSLYLLHDYYYKIGLPSKVKDGVEIDGNTYYGKADIDYNEKVLCLYKIENDKKTMRYCINIPESIYNRIVEINSVYNLPSTTETTVDILSEPVDIELFKSAMKPHDKAAYLEKKGISLWQDNEGKTITRAQVVKTAFKLTDNDFINYPVYPGTLPLVDVSPDYLYYNFISASYNAGFVCGDGNGYFYPERACTWGEALKILCMTTGFGDDANSLAAKNSESAFPKYYGEVLNEYGFNRFDISYDETEIKDLFTELVWDFMCLEIDTRMERSLYNGPYKKIYSDYQNGRFGGELYCLASEIWGNYGSEICIFKKDGVAKAVYLGNDGRYREHPISDEDYNGFVKFLKDNAADELPDWDTYKVLDGINYRYFHFSDEGKKTFYINNPGVVEGVDDSLYREIVAGFEKFIQTDDFEVKYENENVNILIAGENHSVQSVWKDGDDFRVLLYDSENSSKFKAVYNWFTFKDGIVGERVSKPDIFAFAPGDPFESDIRFNNPANTQWQNYFVRVFDHKLHLTTKDGEIVKTLISGSYDSPVVVPGTDYVVCEKAINGWAKPRSAVKINLATSEETFLNLPQCSSIEPLTVLNGKVLIHATDNELKYCLYDVETDTYEAVSGDFGCLSRPFIENRYLQQCSENKYYALSNQHIVGIFDSENYTFEPIFESPVLIYNNDHFWIDENEQKIYIASGSDLVSFSVEIP
ncbi:MAG: S-layer homology domain-containing protein [Clostridia bacterium]|nr:S-layer homology domain-containing protein [Clostridia bacterium]